MRYWINEEKLALCALVPTGLSGQEIAKQLSAQFGRPFTRSAINGQCGRLGIRVGDSRAENLNKPKLERKRGPKKEAVKVVVKAAPPLPPTIEMKPCTIFDLTSSRCRYALWPDHLRAHPDYLYCGAKTHKSPYCEAHSRVVYTHKPERWEGRAGVGPVSALLR